jgi:hypothetical protein
MANASVVSLSTIQAPPSATANKVKVALRCLKSAGRTASIKGIQIHSELLVIILIFHVFIEAHREKGGDSMQLIPTNRFYQSLFELFYLKQCFKYHFLELNMRVI